jgi:hypothetical protein
MPPTLILEIIGDTSGLEKAFRRATRETKQFGDSIERTGKSATTATVGFAGFGKAAVGAAGAVIGAQTVLRGFFSVLNAGIDEFNESSKAAAQTAAALKSTGSVANVTADDIQNLATQIRNYSGIDDEAVQSAENLLLTFKKVRNEVGVGNQIFDRATVAIADMSVRLGIDLKSAALQVGKALQDPTQGLTALRRSGVSFTDAQTKLIRELFATGHALQAQKLILRELQIEFGGSARAAGDTFAGKLAIAKGNLEDFAGVVVERATPAIEENLDRFNKWITNTENQQKVTDLLTGSVDALAGAVATATPVIEAYATAFGKLAAAAGLADDALRTLQLPSLGRIGKGALNGIFPAFALADLFGGGGGPGDFTTGARGDTGGGGNFPARTPTPRRGSITRPTGPSGLDALTRAQRNALARAIAERTATTADDLKALAEQRVILAGKIADTQRRLAKAHGKKADELADKLQGFYDDDAAAFQRITSITEAAAADAKAEAARQAAAAKRLADARAEAAKQLAQKLADARAASLQDLLRSREQGRDGLKGLTLGNLREQFAAANRAANAREQQQQFRALGLTGTGEAFAPTLGAFKAQAAKVQNELKGTLLDTDANRNQLAKIREALNHNWDALTRDTKLKIKELLDALDGLDPDKAASRFRHISPNKLAGQLGFGGGRDATRRAAAVLSQIGAGGTIPARGAAFAGGIQFNGPTTIHVSADDTGRLEAQLAKKARARPQVRRGAR